MSSLQENRSTVPLDVVNKRKASFSRFDSFDKFQFTAFYTLQLAGTLLSQKTLLQIVDVVQYKSRVLLEQYVVLTVWPTFTKICAVFSFWMNAITRYTKINVFFEKKATSNVTVESPEKTDIIPVQMRKMANASAAPSVSASAGQSPTDETKTIDSIEEKRVRLLAEFDALHPHLRGGPLSRTWKSGDSESEMGSNTSISGRQNLGMVVIVYGSATLVYVQLMFLAAFLQQAATPPGLVFLVLSLGYISYIIYEMCFVKAKSKEEISASKARKASRTRDDIVGDLPAKRKGRISRTSTRCFLYFHNKTLSKIKLL